MDLTSQSLKSRGIRFPGRDDESLAPIFTPPSSVPEQSSTVIYDLPPQELSAEESMEALNVARNSIELLSTVLSSSPQQDILQDDLVATLAQQCRQSQYTVQRIVETAGEQEALLFEALNVNDEIQKVLSKIEELRKPQRQLAEPEPPMIPVAAEPEEAAALVRRPPGTRQRNNDDDDVLQDLDDMIFGKKSGSSGKDEGKKDDLIKF